MGSHAASAANLRLQLTDSYLEIANCRVRALASPAPKLHESIRPACRFRNTRTPLDLYNTMGIRVVWCTILLIALPVFYDTGQVV